MLLKQDFFSLDECFRFINELPEKYPQMSIFEL